MDRPMQSLGETRRKRIMTVSELSKSFPVPTPWLRRVLKKEARRSLRALDCVSFDLYEGETLSLVGESGCGKSTLARCVAGLYHPTAGSVRYRDREMENIARLNLLERRDVQMIFQDPYASLNPRWRVGRSIADPILALEKNRSCSEVDDQVGMLLRQVGLSPDDALKYPYQFSGGQRQRIAIARALSTKPAVIICDEPTSALDVSVQAQILNTMSDLQDSLGLTYLFISHNLAVVDHVSTRVGVMFLGRLIELATRDEIFSRPLHPYSQALIGSVPSIHNLSRPETASDVSVAKAIPSPLNVPTGCAYRLQCPHAAKVCEEVRPPLRVFSGRQIACHRVEEIAA